MFLLKAQLLSAANVKRCVRALNRADAEREREREGEREGERERESCVRMLNRADAEREREREREIDREVCARWEIETCAHAAVSFRFIIL